MITDYCTCSWRIHHVVVLVKLTLDPEALVSMCSVVQLVIKFSFSCVLGGKQ
jgi:flagellar biosynthesis protein FliP